MKRRPIGALAAAAWALWWSVCCAQELQLPAETGNQAPPAMASELAQPAEVAVRDELSELELKLPAPYWACYGPQDLAARSGGGCARGAPPPDMLFVLNHKDALATVWVEKLSRSFLVRDKADLERYVDAFTKSVQGQVRGGISDAKARYDDVGRMVVHRLEFSVAAPPGGCGPQPAQPPPPMRYLFVHYFLRPAGADARGYKVFCMAPADAFQALEPEFEFIVSSVRPTAELAEDLFVPDAPEDKLLSPKDATAGGRKGSALTWPLAIGVMLLVWTTMRRRRKAASAGPT